MKDLIIIGSGAAGCSAGIYATRKKLDSLLISKDFVGQVGMASHIENYLGFTNISGLDLSKKFKEHLKEYNIEIKGFEEVLEIKKIENGFEIITDENIYKSKTVIITSGSIPKKLNIENENKFIGKGISYCTTCDACNFQGKIVAVIGSGNAGLQAAIELTNFAKRVYVLECLDSSNADEILIEKINKNSKIETIFSLNIKSFKGNNFLEKIIFEDKNTNKEKGLSVNGCFIEIGYNPNINFCKGLLKINQKNEIVVNPKTMETSCNGIFAAGDVIDFPDKQIILAAGQGALASLSAYKFLTKK